MTLSSRFSYFVAAVASLGRHRWCPVDTSIDLEEASERPRGGFLRGTVGAAAAAGAPQRGEPLVARHHPRERREDGVHARVVAPLVQVSTQVGQRTLL